MKVDFATFCHKGDAHRLHEPGQFVAQLDSNDYQFNEAIVIYQLCHPADYPALPIPSRCEEVRQFNLTDLDHTLKMLGIDLAMPQYESSDKAHSWKYHVVNHLLAVNVSNSDFIVFADNDCWMVKQPSNYSWIEKGIELLNQYPEIFIVSPSDGEPERRTMRFSQQMFLARTEEFREFNFNQPGWDGNVKVAGGPMPEYWAMLEGRMELGCRQTGQCRYVLGPEFRYIHHNRLTEDGLIETDLSKYLK